MKRGGLLICAVLIGYMMNNIWVAVFLILFWNWTLNH